MIKTIEDPYVRQIIALLEKEPIARSWQVIREARSILENRANARRILEIKKWLLENGLNQTELASQLGISLPFLNNIIHGRSSGRKVEKALVSLGIPPDLFEKAA